MILRINGGKAPIKIFLYWGKTVLVRTILTQITGSIIDDYLVVKTSPLKFAKTPSHLPRLCINVFVSDYCLGEGI